MSKLPNNFTVDVPEIGKFTFRRRTMEREFSILAQVQCSSDGATLTGTIEGMVQASPR
jgi:hypothetical protein